MRLLVMGGRVSRSSMFRSLRASPRDDLDADIVEQVLGRGAQALAALDLHRAAPCDVRGFAREAICGQSRLTAQRPCHFSRAA